MSLTRLLRFVGFSVCRESVRETAIGSGSRRAFAITGETLTRSVTNPRQRLRRTFLALVGGLLLGSAGPLQGQSVLGIPYRSGIVFFPPAAPIYGAVIANRPLLAARLHQGRRLQAPDGLAEFVADDFYPALSTHLFTPALTAGLELRLREFRTKRQSQLNELLNTFVEHHDASPEELARRLRAFAEIQTPTLVALEAEAERLREELVGGLLATVDWNARRSWRLGSLPAGKVWVESEAEFQVVRATAYYQKGLLPQQRGFLREIAAELQKAARKAVGLPTVRADSDAMYFSPETARFRLPPDLPPDLRAKISAYNGQKASLQRELRQAVVQLENASPAQRTQAFNALAEKQWPEIRALEELAEDIRPPLSERMRATPPPPPPWLPAALMEQIKTYNEDRDSYFASLHRHVVFAVDQVQKFNPDASPEERAREQETFQQRQAEVRRAATLEFQQATERLFNELAHRYKLIRENLAVVAEKQVDRKTGRPLDADTLLRQYGMSMEEFDRFGREAEIYTHYRTAILQPGLSPEQRRLLFGFALVGLAQPLPGGELLPDRSAKLPYPPW